MTQHYSVSGHRNKNEAVYTDTRLLHHGLDITVRVQSEAELFAFWDAVEHVGRCGHTESNCGKIMQIHLE